MKNRLFFLLRNACFLLTVVFCRFERPSAHSIESKPFNHAIAKEQKCQECHEKDRPNTFMPPEKLDPKLKTKLLPDPSLPPPRKLDTVRIERYENKIKLKHGQDLDCQNCHQPDKGWRFILYSHRPVPSECNACHINDLPQKHFAILKSDCIECHAADEWKKARLHVPSPDKCDECHPADGQLKPVQLSHQPYGQEDCNKCHLTNTWNKTYYDHRQTEKTCTDCHASLLEMSNNNDHVEIDKKDCNSCHLTTNWKSMHFDHEPSPMECDSCHGQDEQWDSFNENHNPVGHNDCITCHNTADWKTAVFSHHPAPTTCNECHQDKLDKDHINIEGQDCYRCHTLAKWEDVLLHIPAPKECISCHGKGEQYDAITKKDPLKKDHPPFDQQDCILCHFTAGWEKASFAHGDPELKCNNCHENDLSKDHIKVDEQDCNKCHLTKDWKKTLVHIPTPKNCLECHKYAELENDKIDSKTQENHKKFKDLDCVACHMSDTKEKWKDVFFSHRPAPVLCFDCHEKDVKEKHFKVEKISCNTCHDSSTWKSVVYNHRPEPKDCNACHLTDLNPKKDPLAGINANADSESTSLESGHDGDETPAANGPDNSNNSESKKHFDIKEQDCKQCHITTAWKRVSPHTPFPKKCENCHGDNQPNDKLDTKHPLFDKNDCGVCHTINQWKTTHFSHDPLPKNCINCHKNDLSKDHVVTEEKSCSACHKVNKWEKSVYDHDPKPKSCKPCHDEGKKWDDWPENDHIKTVATSDCTTCHKTAKWIDATYDHLPKPQECKSCHDEDKKWNAWTRDHFNTGKKDCVDCHKIEKWKDATFDHKPLPNECNSCHEKDRPKVGKWMGQDPWLANVTTHYQKVDCFLCHETKQKYKEWDNKNLNHHDAAGRKIQVCLPCHFVDKKPGTGDYQTQKKHRSRPDFFRPPQYDINRERLGNCVNCHKKIRSFSE